MAIVRLPGWRVMHLTAIFMPCPAMQLAQQKVNIPTYLNAGARGKTIV